MTVKKFWGTAGTGKTTQLLREVEAFLAQGYGLVDMAFCTYSRNMANDFNYKLHKKFDLGYFDWRKPLEEVRFFSTIHGVCNRMLNDMYGRDVVALNPFKKEFCDHLHVGFSGENTSSEIGDVFFSTKSWLLNTFRRDDECVKFGNEYQESLRVSQYLWLKGEWDVFKEKRGVRDFDDMLVEVYKKGIAPPTKILLVDEFQDLSPLQYAIYKIWKPKMEHVVVVGDENQVIYEHQGASPLFIRNEQADIVQTLPLTFRLGKYGWEFARKLLKMHELPVPNVESAGEHEDKPPRSIGTESMPSFIKPERKTFIIANTNRMAHSLSKIVEAAGIPHKGIGGWGDNMLALYNTQLMIMRRHGSVLSQEFLKYANTLKKEHLRKKRKDFTLRTMPSTVSFNALEEYLSPTSLSAIISSPLDFSIFKSSTFPDEKIKGTTETSNRALKLKRALSKPDAHPLGSNIGVYIGTVHCSPPDEPILTTRGYVPISDLVPTQHRLGGYYRKCNKLQWGLVNTNTKNGYDFDVSSRDYDGKLLTIETTRSKTRVTPNHVLPVALADSFMEKYVVYLMRRGDWWRVGICVSAHRPYCSGGVAGRMATEQADCGWILGVFDTREEALLNEAIIQGQFGISGMTFESVSKERSLSTAQLHKVHNTIAEEVYPRALQLLRSYGLLLECPLYTRAGIGNGNVKRNMRGIFETVAANILSGYMEVLVPQESFITRQDKFNSKADRLLATVISSEYVGKVYRLDVKPHHHYVSGGAVVHNSVKGSEAADVFLYDGISLLAERSTSTRAGMDAVARMFFVGATRHTQRLFILDSFEPYKFAFPKMI